MADIFLSYARDDLTTAERIAGALEDAGHSVWWDRHLSAGSRFSKEIDAALRAAEVVVVLWSRSSIDSAWVQDEATFARDHGRLMPVLLDAVEPPLGFRQFQAMTVSRSARKLDALLEAVAKRLGQPVVPQTRPRPEADRAPLRRWGMVAAGVIAILVALSLLLREQQPEPSNIIAVAAAEGGDERRSRELARNVVADLGRYRAGPLGSLSVLAGDRGAARNADFHVEVAVTDEGANLRTVVSLISPSDSKILWTTTEQGPAGRLVDLRQRAIAKLGDVLACAAGASSHSRELGPELLGLYLNGCGRMSDLLVSAPDQEVLSIFRQVTEKAPGFAPGWANLALVEVQSFPGTPAPDRPALGRNVDAHLARAKKLDPTLPETIAADAYFHPNDGTKPEHALAVLDRGLQSHPDSSLLHHMRSQFLRDVGRANEGVTAAQRAMQLNPLSPAIRDSYISGLAYSGRIEAAYKELEEAEAIWPGSTVLQQLRYRLDLRYGDPRAALRALRQRGSGDLTPVPMDTAWAAFLEARIDPAPAKVERALGDFRARYRRNLWDIPGYLQALGTFGRVKEAYEVVRPPVTLDSIMAGTEALFRPHMRSIRSDPRFIALTAKLGLLQYWEKTGVWADFCSEPQLPYDCKAEAAKLTPEQRRITEFFAG